MTLHQTRSMLSKWQQSMSMELVNSVKLSHLGVMHEVLSTSALCIIRVLLFISTGAPWLVTVTVINPTTVTVSWSEVQCFNGSGAMTHYLVQCRSIYDGAIRNVATNSSDQETVVSKLSPNFAQWTFRVAAVYNQSIGPFSNFFNSTVSLGEQAYL